MVVNFDTGFPWLDTFLTVVWWFSLRINFRWHCLVHQGDLQSFLFRYRQLEWIPIPEEIEPIDHDYGTSSQWRNRYWRHDSLFNEQSELQQLWRCWWLMMAQRTPGIDRLMEQYLNLRVLRIENQGKAHTSNIGVGFARELILNSDADTVPEPDALWKYVNISSAKIPSISLPLRRIWMFKTAQRSAKYKPLNFQVS